MNENTISITSLKGNLKEIKLPQGCRLIELPNVADERGELCFLEGESHIPFKIARVFWTYNVKPNAVRGNHAHRRCSMVLFPVGGELTIDLDDGQSYVALRMDSPNVGVLIPPRVWSRQFDFTEHAACVCLASTVYEADDYIYDREEI